MWSETEQRTHNIDWKNYDLKYEFSLIGWINSYIGFEISIIALALRISMRSRFFLAMVQSIEIEFRVYAHSTKIYKCMCREAHSICHHFININHLVFAFYRSLICHYFFIQMKKPNGRKNLFDARKFFREIPATMVFYWTKRRPVYQIVLIGKIQEER